MAIDFKRNATRIVAAGSVLGLGAAGAGAQVMGGSGEEAVQPIDLDAVVATSSTTIDVPVTEPTTVTSTTLLDDGLDRIDDTPDGADLTPNDTPDGVDLTPNDTPDVAPVAADDTPDAADDTPNDTPDGADVTPNDTPDAADVTPNDTPDGADVTPNDTPDGADVTPNDTPDGANDTPESD